VRKINKNEPTRADALAFAADLLLKARNDVSSQFIACLLDYTIDPPKAQIATIQTTPADLMVVAIQMLTLGARSMNPDCCAKCAEMHTRILDALDTLEGDDGMGGWVH
jgi:hypothetical protein